VSFKKTLSILVFTLAAFNTQANLVNNGDFQTCDYSGWGKDTDGYGDVSAGNDFEIATSGGNCRAQINVDHFEPAGDPFGIPVSEAFFANTLFQELDFTGSAGSSFELTIGFEVGSDAGSQDPSFIADYFLFGLNDGLGNYYDEAGNLGFLVGPTDIDGSFRDELTFQIDSEFLNQSGWFLDFQLNIGWDDQTGLSDAFGSSLFINNVDLTEVKASVSEVPEPTSLILSTFALLLLRNNRKSS
jgi:hypothetical protein